MKRQFCKILLAVSFLFLVPALCMSQNLKGIWKLVQSEGSSQVVRYKVLDKDGNYFNVDAYIKDAVDVSSGSRSSDDVFCPYKITRSGEYSIIAKGFCSGWAIMSIGKFIRRYPNWVNESDFVDGGTQVSPFLVPDGTSVFLHPF